MDFSNTSHRWGIIVAFIIIAAVAVLIFMQKQEDISEDTNGPVGTSAEINDAAVPETPQPDTALKTAPAPAAGAIIKTNFGEIEVAFFTAEAPKTVLNFQKLAETGFYANTKFHRVIKDFMIQGGDPLSKDENRMAQWGTGGPGYTFADEINSRKIVRGVLAMANAGADTNGSQFFIVTAEAAPWLDGRHTVFGEVVRGMDVADKINSAATGPNDIPTSPIIVESVVLQ